MKRILVSCWFDTKRGRNFLTGCIDLLLILVPHLLIFSIKGLERSRAKRNEKSALMDLPNDILLDVFTRLPVKSLCHIRSVSKTSLSIVDNPFFATLRLLNPAFVEVPQLMLLTETTSFTPSYRSRFALQSLNYKGEHDLTKSKHYYTEIWSSRIYEVDFVFCNLFGFKEGGHCILVNPLRGEVLDVELPINDRVKTYYDKWYGMGFDHITGTYKIVCIVRIESYILGQLRVSFVAYVYTLGVTSSSWREIHSVPQCKFNSENVSAYGDMHWFIPYDVDGRKTNRIISFDFKKDEFGWIPYPNSPRDFHNGLTHLLIVRGCLAIMSYGYVSLEIWVLKNYEKKVWELDYKIDNKCDHLGSINTCGEWEHGIFYSRSYPDMFYFWDVRDRSIKCIKAKKFLQGIFSHDTIHYLLWHEMRRTSQRIFRYTDSMISLKTFGNSVERQLCRGAISEAAESRTWDLDLLKEKDV